MLRRLWVIRSILVLFAVAAMSGAVFAEDSKTLLGEFSSFDEILEYKALPHTTSHPF